MHTTTQQGSDIQTDHTKEPGTDIPNEVTWTVHGGRGRKYPFFDMEVGDSFFVPSSNTLRLNSSLSGCIQAVRYKTGYKFVRRTIKEPVRGIRVWRIK